MSFAGESNNMSQENQLSSVQDLKRYLLSMNRMPHTLAIHLGDGFHVMMEMGTPIPRTRIARFMTQDIHKSVGIYEGTKLAGELKLSELPPGCSGPINVEIEMTVDKRHGFWAVDIEFNALGIPARSQFKPETTAVEQNVVSASASTVVIAMCTAMSAAVESPMSGAKCPSESEMSAEQNLVSASTVAVAIDMAMCTMSGALESSVSGKSTQTIYAECGNESELACITLSSNDDVQCTAEMELPVEVQCKAEMELPDVVQCTDEIEFPDDVQCNTEIELPEIETEGNVDAGGETPEATVIVKDVSSTKRRKKCKLWSWIRRAFCCCS